VSGIGFGILWPPIGVGVLLSAAIVDGSVRGVLAPIGLAEIPGSIGLWVVYVLYGLSIFWIYGAIVFIPIGIVWSLAVHALGRMVGRPAARPDRRGPSNAGLLLVLAAIAVGGGLAMSLTYRPWATRCLSLPDGTPSAAAFSPAGDLLAVTLRRDSTTPGRLVLLDWPSGRDRGSWPTWVDRGVAVAPDGRVYWSSANYADGTNGIATVMPGLEPTWFTDPNGGSLTDLSWTADGLRGVATDIDVLASVPFAGDHSHVADAAGSESLATYWVSPDGTVNAVTEFMFAAPIVITSASGVATIPDGEGVQSIAVTPDRRSVIAAEASGGLRLIDIATGRSRQLMPGSQEFVALSERGDIAWLNDEPFGPGRLCTSTLAQLGAG
jgi:hypothetical protein